MKTSVEEMELYQKIPKIVEKELAQLPKEEDLHHQFSDTFEQKMENLIDSRSKKRKGLSFPFFSQRSSLLAGIMALIVIGSMTTVLAVAPLRHAVFHFIETRYKEFTSIVVHEERRSGDSQDPAQAWKPVEPISALPGFREIERNQNEAFFELTYRNKKGNEILFFTYPLGSEELIIDTEGVKLNQKDIKGKRILYFEKNGTSALFWHDETSQFRLSGDVGVDQLLDLAEKMITR